MAGSSLDAPPFQNALPRPKTKRKPGRISRKRLPRGFGPRVKKRSPAMRIEISPKPLPGSGTFPNTRFPAILKSAVHIPHTNMITRLAEEILGGRQLTRGEAERVMEQLLSGLLGDTEISSLLSALRTRGETAQELVGFATVMRRHAKPIFAADNRLEGSIVDTCGTGGDGANTFNVSTAAAFVVAGAGVRVAKHGNRSISSRSGSADVLEALGVNVESATLHATQTLKKIGIAFLFAPAVHAAARHAMAARRQLGGRTVFNLLGPLTNPAGATAQLVGVYHRRFLETIAAALGELGVEHAFVVHGVATEGAPMGFDEISLAGETLVAEWRDGRVRTYPIVPEDFGLERAPAAALAGGDAGENAAILRSILAGELGPRRNFVLLAAAATLVVAGHAPNFRAGARQAAESIDSGRAIRTLESLIASTPATQN
jgi:anthranilate phosphoribosyltransferase